MSFFIIEKSSCPLKLKNMTLFLSHLLTDHSMASRGKPIS